MRKPWYGNSDAEIRQHGAQFSSAAAIYLDDVPFTEAEVAEFNDLMAAFGGAVEAWSAAETAARAARENRDLRRAAFVRALQRLGRKVKASPRLNDAVIVEFGMNPDRPATRRLPVTPVDLIATGRASGENVLRWQPGDGLPGAVYLVEASVDGGPWVQLVSQMSRAFVHRGVTPGVFTLYRVTASRRGRYSAPSETASVYGSFAQSA
jgi:hypothetical protein